MYIYTDAEVRLKTPIKIMVHVLKSLLYTTTEKVKRIGIGHIIIGNSHSHRHHSPPMAMFPLHCVGFVAPRHDGVADLIKHCSGVPAMGRWNSKDALNENKVLEFNAEGV